MQEREKAKEKMLGVRLSGSKCLECYTDWVDEYEKDMATLEFKAPEIVAAEVATCYSPETSDIAIIDIGAGTGQLGEKLNGLGFSTIDALDGCEAMLKKAEQKQIYRRIFCERLGPNRLNIDDKSYDVLAASGVFVPSHVKEDCFLELIRIVKPGGRLFFTMGEPYLKVDFFKDFESTIKRHEEEGLWKLISRQSRPDYSIDILGILFIFEVL